MLDIEASFAPVPEFQTMRCSVAERAMLSHDRLYGVEILTSAVTPAIAVPECAIAAPAVKRHVQTVQSDTAHPSPYAQGIAALFAAPPSELLPEQTVAAPSIPSPQAQLEKAPVLSFRVTAPLQDDTPPEARPVTPRRPMRFTFAREAGEPTPVAIPTFNLFDGVFHEDSLDQPDIDPRLRRSRERALARIAAHEAALPPEARNLWLDDATGVESTPPALAETALTAEAPRPSAGSDMVQPRRVVRHLSVKRRSDEVAAPAKAIHDPLQDHLHRIRAALYTVDPSDLQEPNPQPALAHRLLSIMLHLAVLLAALPERVAQVTLSILPARQRDFSLRLATAAGLAAAALTVVAETSHHLLL